MRDDGCCDTGKDRLPFAEVQSANTAKKTQTASDFGLRKKTKTNDLRFVPTLGFIKT